MTVATQEYSQTEVLKRLEEYVDKFPTKGEAADALGVSRVFLWKVLEGQANPTVPILETLGFKRERKITYVYFKV